jgi:hypothetical protein
LLTRSAGDLAKGRFVLGRYIRVAVGLFVLVTKRFSPRHLPLFEATMPRRYARSDVRDSDTTSVDVQARRPALKPRVSRSASLVRRVTRRGSRIAIDGTDFSVFRYLPPFHFSCRARHGSRALGGGREERL